MGEIVDFGDKIYVLIFFFKVSASRHWDRKWSVWTSGWVMIVLDVGVNDNACGLDFFVCASVGSCFQLESDLFGEFVDSLFSVGSDDLNEVVGCGLQMMRGYKIGAKQDLNGGGDGEHGVGSVGGCGVYGSSHFLDMGEIIHGK
jgi:hypothetical protein